MNNHWANIVIVRYAMVTALVWRMMRKQESFQKEDSKRYSTRYSLGIFSGVIRFDNEYSK